MMMSMTPMLVHGVQFATVVQQMAKAEAGQDGDIDLGGHEGAPGEGPALFHAANQERKRGGQDDFGFAGRDVG